MTTKQDQADKEQKAAGKVSCLRLNGAGTRSVNGIYTPVSSFRGKTKFRRGNGGTEEIYWSQQDTKSYWVLVGSKGEPLYKNSKANDPPKGDYWRVFGEGRQPAPTHRIVKMVPPSNIKAQKKKIKEREKELKAKKAAEVKAKNNPKPPPKKKKFAGAKDTLADDSAIGRTAKRDMSKASDMSRRRLEARENEKAKRLKAQDDKRQRQLQVIKETRERKAKAKTVSLKTKESSRNRADRKKGKQESWRNRRERKQSTVVKQKVTIPDLPSDVGAAGATLPGDDRPLVDLTQPKPRSTRNASDSVPLDQVPPVGDQSMSFMETPGMTPGTERSWSVGSFHFPRDSGGSYLGAVNPGQTPGDPKNSMPSLPALPAIPDIEPPQPGAQPRTSGNLPTAGETAPPGTATDMNRWSLDKAPPTPTDRGPAPTNRVISFEEDDAALVSRMLPIVPLTAGEKSKIPASITQGESGGLLPPASRNITQATRYVTQITPAPQQNIYNMTTRLNGARGAQITIQQTMGKNSAGFDVSRIVSEVVMISPVQEGFPDLPDFDFGENIQFQSA